LVAEGIETQEQAAALQAIGCHYLQGYYLARPQSVNDITLQLQQRMAASAPLDA